ncbi:phenylacetate-CoA oxygenase subunit PaaJ [Chitinophagaceae bacterium IBVUCB1]|nr:phenylacetate-CoA oxygenase subunit PaaJ [Chitinophagaceae bacterium IBVUCB1]
MVATTYSKEEILQLLSAIADPEIPVVSISEIGMLRDVMITDAGCEVILTPTYTGCPAMGIIEADIKALLHENGIEPVTVTMVYTPAWTTDWINDAARAKMNAYGIAPPKRSSCGSVADAEKHINCPICNAADTTLVSRYGSTACKALYKCNSCKEPFEYFKCH